MYAVNGLDSRFATLVDIIRHCETLPSFETTRTMLLLKESSFKDDTKTSSTFDGRSSSPTALVTSTSSTPKGSSSKSHTLPQLCNHFSKGHVVLVTDANTHTITEIVWDFPLPATKVAALLRAMPVYRTQLGFNTGILLPMFHRTGPHTTLLLAQLPSTHA
nr:hybrid signal transduction histidine kinase M [Tanacetum cinerariifolium]